MPLSLMDLLPGPDSNQGGSGVAGRPAGASSPGRSEEHTICSRKGCREAASYLLLWNNPRIHTPERRKTWAACAEHRPYLEGFLSDRSFLKEVAPL